MCFPGPQLNDVGELGPGLGIDSPPPPIRLNPFEPQSMYVSESQLSMRALAALQEVADEFLISGYHRTLDIIFSPGPPAAAMRAQD